MNEQKKKIPWWVALLQLLPAVIDSVSKLVKEAKAKKKLKRESDAMTGAKNLSPDTATDTTATQSETPSVHDDKPMD